MTGMGKGSEPLELPPDGPRTLCWEPWDNKDAGRCKTQDQRKARLHDPFHLLDFYFWDLPNMPRLHPCLPRR